MVTHLFVSQDPLNNAYDCCAWYLVPDLPSACCRFHAQHAQEDHHLQKCWVRLPSNHCQMYVKNHVSLVKFPQTVDEDLCE